MVLAAAYRLNNFLLWLSNIQPTIGDILHSEQCTFCLQYRGSVLPLGNVIVSCPLSLPASRFVIIQSSLTQSLCLMEVEVYIGEYLTILGEIFWSFMAHNTAAVHQEIRTSPFLNQRIKLHVHNFGLLIWFLWLVEFLKAASLDLPYFCYMLMTLLYYFFGILLLRVNSMPMISNWVRAILLNCQSEDDFSEAILSVQLPVVKHGNCIVLVTNVSCRE